jgi:hypothetical protein
MAAALGLPSPILAGLVARQPELLEIAPTERLAARAEALAAVLGLKQEAYLVSEVGKVCLCSLHLRCIVCLCAALLPPALYRCVLLLPELYVDSRTTPLKVMSSEMHA